MGAVFEQHTRHIKQSHSDFLRHWMGLTDLEEGSSKYQGSEIWSMSGEEREAARGCCIAGLVLKVRGL